MTTASAPRIAIIGAGIAGVTCAASLIKAGLRPVILEKSRGLGGRMATRRAGDGFVFDHGAQFITARSKDFLAALNNAIERGAAAHWHPNMHAPPPSAPTDWIVGMPAMNAIVKSVAQEFDVRFSTEISAIRRDGEAWRLHMAADDRNERFDGVICTAPAPQARTLLATEPAIADGLAHVKIAPCWALMVAFTAPVDPGYDVRRATDGDLTWIARNAAKPGRRADTHCWVVHAAPDWSERHLEYERDAIVDKMLGMLADTLGGPLPSIEYAAAHRWRYALTTEPLGRPYLGSVDGTLFTGGDWCLGARVECAFESGQAMASAMLDTLNV